MKGEPLIHVVMKHHGTSLNNVKGLFKGQTEAKIRAKRKLRKKIIPTLRTRHLSESYSRASRRAATCASGCAANLKKPKRYFMSKISRLERAMPPPRMTIPLSPAPIALR